MTCLIIILSSDIKNWKFVTSTIKSENWNEIIAICDDFAYNNFSATISNFKKVRFDKKSLENSFDYLSDYLKKEILDFEVALDLSSGSGRENMLLVSSVLRAGLGIRFVYSDESKLKEFDVLKNIKN
jgi:hypothetical protein